MCHTQTGPKEVRSLLGPHADLRGTKEPVVEPSREMSALSGPHLLALPDPSTPARLSLLQAPKPYTQLCPTSLACPWLVQEPQPFLTTTCPDPLAGSCFQSCEAGADFTFQMCCIPLCLQVLPKPHLAMWPWP